MIDNLGAFTQSFGEPGDMGVHDLFARLLADGPGVGIVTVATAKQNRWDENVRERAATAIFAPMRLAFWEAKLRLVQLHGRLRHDT